MLEYYVCSEIFTPKNKTKLLNSILNDNTPTPLKSILKLVSVPYKLRILDLNGR